MSGITSNNLVDKFGRPINYLRLAVTDRCNLRCFYCMPAEGITYLPKKELLTFEEIIRIVQLLANHGVNKLRFTGGEPFMRKDLMSLMASCNAIPGIEGIHITTNGLLTSPYIQDFKSVGIKSVNLSIDSLDPVRFKNITRRDGLKTVLKSLDALLYAGIPTKLNMVVMKGRNEEDILPMAAMASSYALGVRYIEEMPFTGEKGTVNHEVLNYTSILQILKEGYPDLKALSAPEHSTALLYGSSSFKGDLGIIPAFSRTFCGSCNRLRLTSQGDLKTCLYGDTACNLKTLIRTSASDEDIISSIKSAVAHKPKDGFEAETYRNNAQLESMSTIGG